MATRVQQDLPGHEADDLRTRDTQAARVAQDRSQLVRDYDKKESDVIFNTVGNLFAGAVKGDTAEELSKSFGKEDREQRSYQEGGRQTIRHIPISYVRYCPRIRLKLCLKDISADMLQTPSSNTCIQKHSAVKCRPETRRYTMKIFQRFSTSHATKLTVWTVELRFEYYL